MKPEGARMHLLQVGNELQGGKMMRPYALCLLRRFKAGESVEQLAAVEGIPVERISMRLAAAAEFEKMHQRNRRGHHQGSGSRRAI